MNQNEISLYEQVQDSLLRAGTDALAPEVHGSLCGLLCAQGNLDTKRWLDPLFDGTEKGNLLVSECKKLLLQLYQDTLVALNSDELTFVCMLPGEEELLQERAEALGLWCQGFLYGLALGGVQSVEKLPEQVREILLDFSEITKVGHQDLGESDEDEDAFMEVSEFVRISVLLVYDELQPSKAPHRVQ